MASRTRHTLEEHANGNHGTMLMAWEQHRFSDGRLSDRGDIHICCNFPQKGTPSQNISAPLLLYSAVFHTARTRRRLRLRAARSRPARPRCDRRRAAPVRPRPRPRCGWRRRAARVPRRRPGRWSERAGTAWPDSAAARTGAESGTLTG